MLRAFLPRLSVWQDTLVSWWLWTTGSVDIHFTLNLWVYRSLVFTYATEHSVIEWQECSYLLISYTSWIVLRGQMQRWILSGNVLWEGGWVVLTMELFFLVLNHGDRNKNTSCDFVTANQVIAGMRSLKEVRNAPYTMWVFPVSFRICS